MNDNVDRPSKNRLYPHWHCDEHGDFDARIAVGCPECMRLARTEIERLRVALLSLLPGLTLDLRYADDDDDKDALRSRIRTVEEALGPADETSKPRWKCPACGEEQRHPDYIIGNHWLETAYERICAGEKEADVMADYNYVRRAEEMSAVTLRPMSENTPEGVYVYCYASGVGGVCRLERGHSGPHEFV
jgi:hypothetical protein